MQMQHYLYNRITVDPNVCSGKPVIRGMRMPVASILDYLGSGMTVNQLIHEFSFLENEDVSEALAFSASMLQDSFIPIKHSA